MTEHTGTARAKGIWDECGALYVGRFLYAILSRLGVSYLAKEPVRIFGEYFVSGEPVVLLPDALIVGKDYEAGVFEVDGSSHRTKGAQKWDDRKDVKQNVVEAILSRHRRNVDDYNGGKA